MTITPSRYSTRHDLHLILGDLFRRTSDTESCVLCDVSCGGTSKVPMFFKDKRSSATKCSEVDAAYTVNIDNRRYAIGVIEIEERTNSGGFRPERLRGKFMNASSGIWLAGPDHERIPLIPGFFLQILNTGALPLRSKKLDQYDEISADIDARFLPLQWIREYWHAVGTPEEFATEPYHNTIRQFFVSMKRKYGRVSH